MTDTIAIADEPDAALATRLDHEIAEFNVAATGLTLPERGGGSARATARDDA